MNLARYRGVRWMANCGVIEKARWWIVISLGVTLWGSQPRHWAVYVFGVDVVTEEVEDTTLFL